MTRGTGRLVLAMLACATPSAIARPFDTTPSVPVPGTHVCRNDYPEMSRRLNHEGAVLVRYDVGADGSVTRVVVVRSSGDAWLDQAAVTCVSRYWRNIPASRDGKPVASPGHLARIAYVLNQSDTNAVAPLSPAPNAQRPAAPSADDTGDYDFLTFLVWTLGPIAVVAWIVRFFRLFVFRRRDCPSCNARNRSIVPFTLPTYCSTCGVKFARRA